jgi:hypothetical protein
LAFRQKAPELLPAAFFKGKRLEVGLNLLPFGNLTTWGSHIKPLTVESDRERVSPPSGQLLKSRSLSTMALRSRSSPLFLFPVKDKHNPAKK